MRGKNWRSALALVTAVGMLQIPTSVVAQEPFEGAPPAAVTKFVLVDADKDALSSDVPADIMELQDGAQLVLSDLPENLNIRAITEPDLVGSVLFSLNGSDRGFRFDSRRAVENFWPYAAGGDFPIGNYLKLTLTPGSYTLTATPYLGGSATGLPGSSLTVQFLVSSHETTGFSAPTDYSEVAPGYTAAHAATLAAGREVVDALLTGDTGAAYARFSEQLKELVSEDEFRAAFPLRTDRVRFEDPAVNLAFDGRLIDGIISGRVNAGGQNVGTFFLERSFAADPAAPLVGQWKGTLMGEETELGITVVFETEGAELIGTIGVPELGVSDPLENVRYEPSLDMGEVLAESVLPLSPDLRAYASEQAWGAGALVLTFLFDGSGTIIGIEEPHGRASLPPDPAGDFTSETEFRLPFDGVWWVTGGGAMALKNHHVVAPNQRHAYDLVVWKEGGASRGDGSRNEDHWAWDEPVLAPADGTVVTVLDGIEDNPNPPRVLNPEAHPAGNHVVLNTGADEFLYIAHFQQGSIQVKEGDEVTAGAFLGLTGNSGNSSGPHIHIHLQNEEDFFSPTAIGLPLPFTGYRADGEPVSVGSPVQGQLIQHAQK